MRDAIWMTRNTTASDVPEPRVARAVEKRWLCKPAGDEGRDDDQQTDRAERRAEHQRNQPESREEVGDDLVGEGKPHAARLLFFRSLGFWARQGSSNARNCQMGSGGVPPATSGETLLLALHLHRHAPRQVGGRRGRDLRDRSPRSAHATRLRLRGSPEAGCSASRPPACSNPARVLARPARRGSRFASNECPALHRLHGRSGRSRRTRCPGRSGELELRRLVSGVGRASPRARGAADRPRSRREDRSCNPSR